MTPQMPTQPRNYIHWNPERTDYSVTPEELQGLCNASDNLWKDVCLVTISLGIPCIINAVAETSQQTQYTLTLVMFLNFLIGFLGLGLAIIFGVAWFKSRKSIQTVLNTIKNKPKIQILPQVADVGALPTVAVTASEPKQPN